MNAQTPFLLARRECAFASMIRLRPNNECGSSFERSIEQFDVWKYVSTTLHQWNPAYRSYGRSPSGEPSSHRSFQAKPRPNRGDAETSKVDPLITRATQEYH